MRDRVIESRGYWLCPTCGAVYVETPPFVQGPSSPSCDHDGSFSWRSARAGWVTMVEADVTPRDPGVQAPTEVITTFRLDCRAIAASVRRADTPCTYCGEAGAREGDLCDECTAAATFAAASAASSGAMRRYSAAHFELARLTRPPSQWVTRSDAIAAVREAARPLGYAVAVHGSLRRDVDLVAVPWVDDAATAEELVAAVCTALPGGGHVNGPPADKPHLRRAWSIIALAADPRDPDGWYIDLSVLPTFGALVTAANQDAFSVERCEGCSAVVASDTCWRDSEGVALCPDCGASHQEHAGGSW